MSADLDIVKVQTVVIGAGVVGIAVARELALAGKEVVILESCDAFGTQTSSRNSEVVHAGIYYPPKSNKAVHCVAGNKLLYEFCEERLVPYKRIGKLIVATDDSEMATLTKIFDNAELCGVNDLQILNETQFKKLEPEVTGVGAILSPSTGIVDSHSFMQEMLFDFQNSGGLLSLYSSVKRVKLIGKSFELLVEGEQNYRVVCDELINCAGHGAVPLAIAIEELDEKYIPKQYFAKGTYFAFSGKSPFNKLIYPVPVPGALGIHATLDLSGVVKFGPNIQWIDSLEYTTDGGDLELFDKSIRKYWKSLPKDSLGVDYCGVRPKIHAKTEPAADFIISTSMVHGVKNLVNLFGIESPGLTSSLSLAKAVRSQFE